MEKLTHKQLGELIVKAKNGDMDAFAKFYSATYKPQYFIALTILKDSTKAEDAVADTYSYLLQHLDSIQKPEMIVAYLNKATNSSCMSLVRKEKREVPTDFMESNTPIIDTNPTPADIVNQKSEENLVILSLSKLEKPLSDVLTMRFAQDMKIDDIAANMNVSPRTIKRYIKKGSIEMKKIYEELKNKVMNLSIFSVPFAANLIKHASQNSINIEKGQDIYNRIVPPTVASASLASIGAVGVSAGVAVGTKIGIGVIAAASITTLSAGLIANPDVSISSIQSGWTSDTVVVDVKNNNILPITSIDVIDSEGNMYLQANGSDATFKIADNGDYTIIVHSLNGKTITSNVNVNTIDHTCPVVTKPVYDGDYATFEIYDDESGLDTSSIVLTDNLGKNIPFEINGNSITYSSSYTDVNVFSKDVLGNEIYANIQNK